MEITMTKIHEFVRNASGFVIRLLCIVIWMLPLRFYNSLPSHHSGVHQQKLTHPIPSTINYDMAPTCPAPIYGPTMADVCPAPNAVMFMMTVDAALRKDDSIAQISARVTSVDPETDYDFIVVGSGAGGSPVAGRLSKISDWKVLVLEAGVDEPIGTAVPSFNTCFTNSSVDWNYTTIEPNACLSTGGKCSWPRGKVLGGTTVIHGMMYTRGNPTDYKNWASEGLEGWTWSEVEPWFLVSENNTELDRLGTEHHARGGLMTVERLPYREPFDDDILIAAMEAGYAVTEDLCTDFSGYSIAQMMSKGGVRVSSAAAFLRPNRNRKNLHVSLESQATKIIIKDGRAIGVEYFKDGQLRKAYALKEVIVAGGAINSPQLLLLSGIGPRKDLEAVGIEVIKDLPGVGRNLHNHVSYTMSFTINDTYTYRMDKEALEQYLLDRRGPMSSKGIIATAILASNLTEPHFPDVQIFFRGYDAACAPGPRGALVSEGRRPIQISACYQHPKSRGYLRLASADPFDYPIMSANYFAEPGDVDGLVEAIKLALKIVDTPTMKSHDMQLADEPLEACSDHTFMSDKYLACAVRQNTSPENHQTGSAKMGPKNDSMAVVDEKFRVYGIEGLRVVDASIMPSVISSNPTAAIVMFGERAAAFIQEAWLYAS